MLVTRVAAALFVLAAVCAAAPPAVDESDVQTVTLDNIMDFVSSGKGGKGVFLQFAAPWCGFCKRLKPGWAQFATESKGKYPVGTVDVDAQPELRSIYNVHSFPTVMYIDDARAYVYGGERTLDEFTAFAEVPREQREKEAKSAIDLPKFPQTDVTFAGVDELEDATTNEEIDELIAGSGSRTPIIFMGLAGRTDTERALPLFKKISAVLDSKVLVINIDMHQADREVAGRFYLGAPIMDTRAGIVKDGNVHWFDATLREKDVMADIRRGTTNNVVPMPKPRSKWLVYRERAQNMYNMLYLDAITMYSYKKGILAVVAAAFYFAGILTAYLAAKLCCGGGACAASKGKGKGKRD